MRAATQPVGTPCGRVATQLVEAPSAKPVISATQPVETPGAIVATQPVGVPSALPVFQPIIQTTSQDATGATDMLHGQFTVQKTVSTKKPHFAVSHRCVSLPGSAL